MDYCVCVATQSPSTYSDVTLTAMTIRYYRHDRDTVCVLNVKFTPRYLSMCIFNLTVNSKTIIWL